MKIYLTISFCFIVSCLFGQISKPPLDSGVFNRWLSVRDGAMTSDGDYCMYNIDNEPVGSQTLVVKALESLWEMRIPDAAEAKFVDNNIVLFLRKKDSLCVYTLRDKQMKWIPDVRSYQVGKNGDKKYLISLLANGNLVITGFENGERHEFAAVNDFRLAFEDSVIVL